MAIMNRVLNLFRRARLNREIEAELAAHLDLRTEDNLKQGMEPSEARRDALLRFGNRTAIRERVVGQDAALALASFGRDLGYGLRQLRRNPGFAWTAVLVIALGVGACTAIFGLVKVVLDPALPYSDVDHLAYLYTPNLHLSNVPRDALPPSNADYADIARLSRSFQAMTEFEQVRWKVGVHGAATFIGAARVDAGFFQTLASFPVTGRAFDVHDMQPGHDAVAVISQALWRQLFAGSGNVLSRAVELNGRNYRVVGVMPQGFNFPHNTDLDYGNAHIEATDAWVPLSLSADEKADRVNDNFYALARLKPGVSLEQAQAEQDVIMKRLDPLHAPGPFARGWLAYVKPFRETLDGSARPAMRLLVGAVSLLLLIACGNTANLLLARSAARSHELTVRTALGAGRGRLVRQMLTEALLLAAAGGLAGAGFGWLLLRLLLLLNPGTIPRLQDASFNAGVFIFAAALALLVGSLTGIAAALASSRVNLIDSLKTGGNKGALGGYTRLRSGLIVGEVAVALVLLAGTGLLVRSYIELAAVRTGFSPATVSMHIELSDRYRDAARSRELYRVLFTRIRALPGVQAVGAVTDLPFSGSESVESFWLQGYANERGQTVQGHTATPGYFLAMETPIVQGRGFTDQDAPGHPEVVLVNQAFVKAYLPGRNPIGFWVAGDQPKDASGPLKGSRTIVGVVADMRHTALEQPAPPQMYASWEQRNPSGGSFVVRSSLPAAQVLGLCSSVLHSIDPELAFTDAHTMGELVRKATAQRRFQTVLLVVFTAAALLLAAIGIYGLITYSVRQRSAEIGVRLALGASRASVLLLIVRQGLRLVLVGIALGLFGAFGLTHILSSLLYGVKPVDPVTFCIAPLLLLLAGLAACLVPGWHAARIDPVQSLRSE